MQSLLRIAASVCVGAVDKGDGAFYSVAETLTVTP